MVSSISGLPEVRAEPIECALRDRVLGLGAAPEQTHWRSVLLTSGEGAIMQKGEPRTVKAPCLAWFPSQEGRAFRIKAGGVGYHLAIGDQVLANAIGHNPESSDLRYFLDGSVMVSLDDAAETVADARHAFDVIVREIRHPKTGAWTLLQAQVRTLLVLLWRTSGGGVAPAPAHGQTSRLLLTFRQLLEAHFRNRWTVRAYAEALGISTDRLHDICTRELGRTPQHLVQERTIYEARLRLERSAQTVDQVAGALGFPDVGHFSRFFKAKVGLPPGAYRDRAAQAAADGRAEDVNYSDWP